MVAAAAFILTSCEGPAGPEGPIGPAGPKGDTGNTGAVGPQGESGTAGCIVCHDDSQTISAKSLQYENSAHAMNDNAAYGNRLFGTVYPAGECAKCHTSQGFLEFYSTGTIVGAPYSDVQQPNCYTCHEIHNTFTAPADWSLTYADAFNMTLGGASYDKGNSNLCAKCHQSTTLNPIPSVGGSDVVLTSDRWGTHHSPAANVLAGEGLYEIVGTTSYPSGTVSHYATVSNGCVTCHMAEAYGSLGGGHTMHMYYDVHGTETLNTAGCVSCHSNTTTLKADILALQTEVETKLETLRALLETANIYDPANGRNKKATFTADVAGAYLNWQTISEDKSLGVHNPSYIIALLDNSIEVMTAYVASL